MKCVCETLCYTFITLTVFLPIRSTGHGPFADEEHCALENIVIIFFEFRNQMEALCCSKPKKH